MHGNKNYGDTKSCFQHMRRGLRILERHDTVNKTIFKKWGFERGPDLARTIYSFFKYLYKSHVKCGDKYCRPYTYCRRRQLMPVLSAHIIALKHTLQSVSILFSKPMDEYVPKRLILSHKLLPAIEYVVNFETLCLKKLY